MSDQVSLLIAEDEPIIRMMVEDALEDAGFAVEVATNGSDAIITINERGAHFAGIVTDIRLGNGPDGWALAHRAREVNPLVCVIYMTGDSAAEWAANGVPKSVLLQKPFASAQLVTAMAELLNETSSSPPAAETS